METIQTLLTAEEESKKTVEEARKMRDARLKQAASEAETQIAAYRAEKEQNYQDQIKAVSGSTGATTEQIAADKNQSIKSIKNASKASKPAVVDMLVSFVRNVDTSV